MRNTTSYKVLYKKVSKAPIIFEKPIREKCFWCGIPFTPCNTKTKDHFISTPLCRLLKNMKKELCSSLREMTCPCCAQCNNDRSRISDIIKYLYTPYSSITLKRFIKFFTRISSMIYEYREKISNKLTGELRDLCLLEIDTMIAFKATIKKMIEIEAYYMWERNDKPIGKDDYFWFMAQDIIFSSYVISNGKFYKKV